MNKSINNNCHLIVMRNKFALSMDLAAQLMDQSIVQQFVDRAVQLIEFVAINESLSRNFLNLLMFFRK